MADEAENKKTELFDGGDDERFLLTSKAAIANVLVDLGKRPDILTAYFNQGHEYILTAVLAVMPERNLLVLDYGADEKLNQRLLEYGRAVCVTKHDNINIKFGCNILQRAKYQDRQALAASLPESLFRQQRREFFRVALPIVNAVKCYVPQPDGSEMVLHVADISCGGAGLVDPQRRFNPEVGTLLAGCRVVLPETGTLVLDLVVRNSFLQAQNDGNQVRRIGCAFAGLPLDKNAVIQRYIHRVQIEQKALQNRG
jgi:c-di-GMP-binding flagellar brake protein YcgR